MITARTIFTLLLPLMAFDGNKGTPFTEFIQLKGHDRSYTAQKIHRMQDLEYPRKDCKILRVLNEMWGNYYACLSKKENQEIKPEIRRLLAGQSTELTCDFCERPFQNSTEIQWKYKPLSTTANITELQYLDLTTEMTLTKKNTLKIYNANKRFSGLYACFHGKTVLSIYILEVSENDEAGQVEEMNSNAEKITILGTNFYVSYHWTNFTECSACGKVGKKYKYGICYVSLPNDNERSYLYIVNNTRKVRSFPENFVKRIKYIFQKKDFKKDENSGSEVYNKSMGPELIMRFRNGIPCASPYLGEMGYDFLNKFSAVKVLVNYCSDYCEEDKIFEVIDRKGRVVEIANNSEGIHSLFQELPRVPLGIERLTLVARFGSKIVIQCPGTARTNTPVVWMTNGKIIHPHVINKASNGRFTIDFTSRIHIKKLRLKDSRIYSCWQRDKLVGTVHLNVEKKFGITFNHHVTLIITAVIILVLLFLGSKILTRELNMRKK